MTNAQKIKNLAEMMVAFEGLSTEEATKKATKEIYKPKKLEAFIEDVTPAGYGVE